MAGEGAREGARERGPNVGTGKCELLGRRRWGVCDLGTAGEMPGEGVIPRDVQGIDGSPKSSSDITEWLPLMNLGAGMRLGVFGLGRGVA